MLVVLLIGSNLPDFDFLPGLLIGSPDQYHRAFSHSLLFCLLATVPLLIYLKVAKIKSRAFISLMWLIAILTHLAIDWVSLDVSDPAGIELLWPFSGQRFMSDPVIFPGARRDEIFSSFTLSYNLFAVTWEILLLVPFVALCRFFYDRANRDDVSKDSCCS
jgi:membrane-bound metal-dependent hydrolase YbcI (DUF457 family)